MRLRGFLRSAFVSSSTQVCPAPSRYSRSSARDDLDQWPNHVSALRIDPTQPGHAGTANQLQQKRLRLIVPRVANRHAIGANLDRASTQRFVAQPPCGILNRESLRGCIRPDVHGLDVDRHTELSRKFAAELLVAPGIWPQLVIDVREGDDAEAAML